MDITNQYTIKLLSAIKEVFNEDSENFISLDELMKDNNATHFFHALANLAPAMLYTQITNEDVNTLEFNHIANRLVFQYAKQSDVIEED